MVKVMLVIGFLIAFGAGLTVGWQFRGHEALAQPAAATRPTGRAGFLEVELGLNEQQREQMKRIWSETAHRGGREQDEKRRAFRKERDDAIAALIRPEDRERYDQVVKAYADRNAALEQAWRSNYQNSVAETKKILNPEQRKKYEEILKKQENRRAEEHATSRPGADKPI
jgi:Spy/CpxP family protein refolding chaperone